MTDKRQVQSCNDLSATKTVDSSSAKSLALPALVLKVRRQALEDLHQMLTAMFCQADDLFFEFASKSGDTLAQDHSLEAMRELRLRRKQCEKVFFVELARGFKALEGDAESVAPTLKSVAGCENLSLMETDEVEQVVAIEAMVSKARNAFAPGLFQLTSRFDALIPQLQVDQANNPLDPQQVCDAFRVATEIVHCDIKYRLIFFKLFQRDALDHYDRVLDNCNYILAQAGVLPDLKGTPQASRPAVSRPGSAAHAAIRPADETCAPGQAPQAEASTPIANQHLTQLQALLASIHQASANGDASLTLGSAPNLAPIGSAAQNAQMMASSDLLSLLNRMQQQQPLSVAALFEDTQVRFNPRLLLENLLKQQEAKSGPKRVEQSDSDVINLISMLFDFILDDDNIPVRVKALLARLQIPYLKIAIADRGFLGRGGHAARKLLNELARAGIGLSGDKDQVKNDQVFQRMVQVVERILNEYVDDIALFEQLLEEFSCFMAQETRRADMVAKRTATVEEGRARTELAKQQVSKALQEKLQDKVLPTAVARIVDGPWTQYLHLVWLKQGEHGKAWQLAMRTIDQLLASVTPAATAAEKKNLCNMVPILLKNLRTGFAAISLAAHESGELLDGLEKIQMQVLRGLKPDYLADLEAGKVPCVALDEAAAEVAASAGDHGVSQNLVRMDVSSKTPSQTSPDLPSLSELDPHFVAAKKLQLGTWLELDEGDQKIRCKLAGHLHAVDRMIFVNRIGMKVMEKRLLEVAYDIKSGKLTVLDDSQLFDRALESVIANLRTLKAAVE